MTWNPFKRDLQQIGTFDLLGKLGEGGLGSVYKARHRGTGDVVAVKVVGAEVMNDPVLSQRFQQEFQATRCLDHPHIVRTLEMGLTGTSPYLVMEFVDGQSLEQYITAKGELPEKEAIGIITQVAGALEQIHQRGLVHRDVKPANILLTPAGHAKLTDFGLVKDLQGQLEITAPASMLGTPNFMAPEQFEDARHVDCRSDVYSLAATLYMAVTGQVPFRSRTCLGILKLKLLDQIPSPRQLVPSLSLQTEWTIRRAMSADPGQRPLGCSEFVQNLTGMSLKQGRGLPPSRIPASSPLTPAAEPSVLERRGSMRFACDLESSCRPIQGNGWDGRVHDVSAGGIALLVPRRIEAGTVLMVGLQRAQENLLSGLLAKVVRVQAQPPRSWVLGCKWSHGFNPEDLRTLV